MESVDKETMELHFIRVANVLDFHLMGRLSEFYVIFFAVQAT